MYQVFDGSKNLLSNEGAFGTNTLGTPFKINSLVLIYLLAHSPAAIRLSNLCQKSQKFFLPEPSGPATLSVPLEGLCLNEVEVSFKLLVKLLTVQS